MKINNAEGKSLATAMPYTLLEAVLATYGKPTMQSEIADRLINSQAWFSLRCELRWQFRKTKASRFYLQLAVRIPKTYKHRSLFPTPMSFNGKAGTARKLSFIAGEPVNLSKKNIRYGITLRQLAENGLLPTPLARLAKVRCNVDRQKGNLQDAIAAMVPPGMSSPQVNPEFISEMMGFPAKWLHSPFKK